MSGATLKSDVSGAYSAISSVNLCVTGPFDIVTAFGCTWLWLVNNT